MNGKEAKRLRRLAEAQTIGKAWASGGLRRNLDSNGKMVGARVQIHSSSGKGVYQKLKKEQTNGSR